MGNWGIGEKENRGIGELGIGGVEEKRKKEYNQSILSNDPLLNLAFYDAASIYKAKKSILSNDPLLNLAYYDAASKELA